jgi:hypothetical protein
MPTPRRVGIGEDTGTNLATARAMIEAARDTRVFDGYLESEAEYVLSCARALDAASSNPKLLREYRLALGNFTPPAPPEPGEMSRLADLIVALSGAPADAWERACQAAPGAGADPAMAQAVAGAATTPDKPVYAMQNTV